MNLLEDKLKQDLAASERLYLDGTISLTEYRQEVARAEQEFKETIKNNIEEVTSEYV